MLSLIVFCKSKNGLKFFYLLNPFNKEKYNMASSFYTDHKIVSTSEIVKIVHKLKSEQKRIVFTNGCFDILHVGHVRYLQQASTYGDVLIAGVNSDQSVRRQKGEKRPIVSEENRAYLLSSLAVIDYIVIFEEETPLHLISQILPHTLIKGGDYQVESIVGYDIVTDNQGQVLTIPVIVGQSTTSIIERILEKQ